ncbi:ceramidase domain-containing protein [Thalassobius sp. MITS945101]|uniref:ceramidase domain-containing protein n=1 Tax=Thalassobius sp. MITS945101 TaxID=3096994 RepID=UPI00399B4CDC
MDWRQQVDSYCERVDPSFWAEPVNFVTNLAFILGALWIWPRVKGLIWGQVLAANLFVIGVGSGLFHSYAEVWAAAVDVLPILSFVLIYIYIAHRSYWGHSVTRASIWLVAFVPFVALTVPLFQLVPGLGGSASYAPVALLIALHAVLLRSRLPQVARGLGIGAALLAGAILARSLDLPLCQSWPMGTHFLWHILNAVMLTHMIGVYRAHMLAATRAER